MVTFRDWPIAFHITFGTYGTRLHGDPRGTVDRRHNFYGDPIIGADADWQREEQVSLKFPVVLLDDQQRRFIESTIPAICDRGTWKLHVCAAKEDHVHTVLSTSSDGQVVRRLLKRWLSDAVSQRWPRLPGQAWWAECGSVKWVWTQDYYQQVYDYVRRQRTMPEPIS
jgi:REP element-mobilizing transposase RayT